MSHKRFIDFKLYLTLPEPESMACQVALLPTPEVGESPGPVTIAKERAPSQDLVELLEDRRLTGQQLVELGRALANCLLPEAGGIRGLFVRALERAKASGGGVRLRLVIADPRLEAWPWEALYVELVEGPDSLRGFLALDPRVSIVRHTPLPFAHPLREAGGPELEVFAVLPIGASPSDADALAVAEDLERVRKAVDGLRIDGQLRFECAPPLLDATIDAIRSALLEPGRAQVVHFSGHGQVSYEPSPFGAGVVRTGHLLAIGDPVTKTRASLRAELFATILAGANVQLAVLSACRSGEKSGPDRWSGVAGALVEKGIPAVVGMQHRIGDAEALEFSSMFYAALGAGLSLDEAMTSARVALMPEHELDPTEPYPAPWCVPVLYSRIPDGMLWPERMATASAAAEEIRRCVGEAFDHVEQAPVRVEQIVRVEQVPVQAPVQAPVQPPVQAPVRIELGPQTVDPLVGLMKSGLDAFRRMNSVSERIKEGTLGVSPSKLEHAIDLADLKADARAMGRKLGLRK